MSKQRNQKYQDIRLHIEGKRVLVKGVTKWTTCGDVIKMVIQKLPTDMEQHNDKSYRLFEMSRGTKRLLPAKNKLLKVMRSWTPSKRCEFVVKKAGAASKPHIAEAKKIKLTRNSTNGQAFEKSCYGYTREQTVSYRRDNCKRNNQTSKIYNGSESQKDNMKIFNETYITVSENVLRHRLSSGCRCCNNDQYGHSYDSFLCYVEGSRNVTGRSESSFSLIDSRDITMVSQTKEVKYAVRKILKSLSFESSVYEEEQTSNDVPCQTTNQSTPRDYRIKPNTSVRVKHEELAQNIKYQIANMDQREGKEAILNKYFADYLHYQSPNPSLVRGRGDGAESNPEDDYYRRGDGSSYMCYSSDRPINKTHDSLNKAIIDLDVTSDSGHEDGEFDIAFIDEKVEDACYRKLVDYSLTESDISDIECDTDNDLSNMSSVSDFVRSVFNENIVGDEDDEIDSFMITKLSDEISDEGLSSMGNESES